MRYNKGVSSNLSSCFQNKDDKTLLRGRAAAEEEDEGQMNHLVPENMKGSLPGI